jgi:signal transduction histidine kinase
VQGRADATQEIEAMTGHPYLAIAAWLFPLTILAGLAACAGLLRSNAKRRAIERERQFLLDELESYTHTAAHDLRTPLSSIVGYGSMVKEMHRKMKAAEVDERMDDIVRLSFKASSMLDGLLLLSEVRSADPVPVEALEMSAIVGRAMERLKALIAGAEAQVLLPERWPAASGYGPWVEKVWEQYLSNAIRYGGRPPRLELGAQEEADGIRFWVRDNGPGLDEGQRRRLFVPFERLHAARTRGHGLGLSIVQRIVQKLGGRAGVESEPGKGSTFFFVLPRR